ncbi:hypothetical protein K6Y31_21250 [Motilimonas cestriensis]|uniref:Actin-like protein N-terminal domain-containing protein n=1 Tax=Motilimonas cestriensis TaxID=2742685 RepID=A0ABS8WHT8_9GAMM|nr:hypothetical protein [Motilimonas cestriensis]MCE2597303.1 hypothetical protein [Motilimonas cestriensis]
MSDLIARTIDLGFGTTTVITNVVGSDVQYRTFQSIAAPLEKGKGDITSGSFGASRIVKVCVDGIYYAVGEDVQSYVDNHESRVLNNSFIKSKQYQAIFLASLSMMTDLPINHEVKKVIDLLAMGLPVNNMTDPPGRDSTLNRK